MRQYLYNIIMGRKKLNFSRKEFKKSDAQTAGFATKGAALKFFKHTPKNKLDNFKSVVELVDYTSSVIPDRDQPSYHYALIPSVGEGPLSVHSSPP